MRSCSTNARAGIKCGSRQHVMKAFRYKNTSEKIMASDNLGTDRNEAVCIIADGLGSEGTREQAETIFDYMRKHDAIVHDGQVFRYSPAVEKWLEDAGRDEDIETLWSIILEADENSDARKMLDFLVDNTLFHLVSFLEADGTMSQHWPVWADREHSEVVGFYGESEDEYIAGEEGIFDEDENEYYFDEPTDERIRVSKTVLALVRKVKADNDLRSQNDAVAFLLKKHFE